MASISVVFSMNWKQDEQCFLFFVFCFEFDDVIS